MDAITPYILKYATQSLPTLFSQLKSNTDDHIEVVDPICTMIKIALLKYKPKYTRIGINNNKVDVQDPGLLQGAGRWYYGDGRNDLYQLRYPIIYFIGLRLGYFDVPNFLITQEQLDHINDMVIIGLIELKKTYEGSKKNGSMVCNCLEGYINELSNPYSKDDFMKNLLDINKPTLFVIYNEFIKKWQQNDIDLILNIFDYAKNNEDKNDDIINQYANSINALVDAKDLEIDTLRPD